MRRDKPLKAQATIMKADCVKNGSGNTCSLDISFKDNKENTVTTSIKLDTQTYYKHDQTVAVYYNEKNPKDVTTSNINLKTIGTVVITIGSIITLLGLIGGVVVYRRV